MPGISPNKLKALKLSSAPCAPAPKVSEACKELSAGDSTNVPSHCPKSQHLHVLRASVGYTPHCRVMARAEPGKVLLFAVCVLRSLLQATALSCVQI